MEESVNASLGGRAARADERTTRDQERFERWKTGGIATLALLAILLHLVFRFGLHWPEHLRRIPLLVGLALGGLPLVYDLAKKLWRREFGSDLLAGISIITATLLGEFLAGVLVVLMLSGGEALERFAVRNASSVLRALAKRMPTVAHRKRDGQISDLPIHEIAVGDTLVVYPHEICPVDGTVTEGHGVMDESYLTGEPFMMSKAPGSAVISGAINGERLLVVRAEKRAVDSRYARIMDVMRESEQTRPKLRRLGDQLGAIYTPVALLLATAAWVFSGEAVRFLAVLVIATPCPLLIAIPVSIIGSISLSARRAIIIRNPLVLEQVTQCRIAIFDKTGTLTYGEPTLTDSIVAGTWKSDAILALAASLELYSKHPLARAILAEAKSRRLSLSDPTHVSEPSGAGLRGKVARHDIEITSRKKAIERNVPGLDQLPPEGGGLECVVLIDGSYAATFRFRDAPRSEGRPFIQHLGDKHGFERVMIISGDRESEVRYLAEAVGISEIHAQMQPEDKLAIVRAETAKAKTLYVGDGINDAPAMMAATVGMAVGQNSDVTIEAAGAVAMENSLQKVDEFMHIGRRMRSIALQSAVGGMILSIVGMLVAAAGHLTPVAGAVSQEVIDVLAVLNALRAALPPRVISDI